MSSQTIWLNHPLRTDAPNPPAIPPLQLSPFLTIEKDGANVTLIQVTSHTGTHVDAPCHVEVAGIVLTDFRPEELIFTRPVVVDLPLGEEVVVQPDHLAPLLPRMQPADLLLFRFGYGALRRNNPARYSAGCPGFGMESARWLRQNLPGLRALGMDVPSLACIAMLERTMAAHNELLGGAGRRFLVIEDMKLDEDLSGLAEVIVAPWWIEGIDGGPALVFGRKV